VIDDVCDTQSVFAVDDDDFSLGNQAAVEQKIYGGMESILQFDDNARTESEHIAEQHAAGSETMQRRGPADVQDRGLALVVPEKSWP
jgi:hypothetical protein